MNDMRVSGNPINDSQTRRKDRYSVEIAINGADRRVSVASQPGFTFTFEAGDLLAMNSQFIAILENLRRDILQRKTWDLTGYAHPYLEQLRRLGIRAYNRFITKPFRDTLQDVERRKQRELTLTFRTEPAWSLLWDMIYAEDGDPDDTPLDVNKFWGFHFPIGTAFTLENVYDTEDIEIKDGIFTAINERLPDSVTEITEIVKMVETARQSFQLSRLGYTRFGQEIPVETLEPGEFVRLLRRQDFRYGLVHFACHCENPKNAPAAQAQLIIETGGKKFQLSISNLEEYFNVGGFKFLPLVFLNACESDTVGHLLQNTSFPESFLRFGAGGVIATACTIPDKFASAFSREFYLRLFKLNEQSQQVGRLFQEFSSNVGEALMATRLLFLQQYNNPLGLAYGLYGVSKQKVRFTDD